MKLLFIVLCTHLPFTLQAQVVGEEVERNILVAQDLRDVEILTTFLRSKEPAVRAKAALSSGSVQDTLLISILTDLLRDTSDVVRAASAFAIGQLNYVVDSAQRRIISQVLVDQLRSERSDHVLQKTVEGLGKVGDLHSLSELIELAEQSHVLPNPEVSLSIGRYAFRGIMSERGAAYA
ncbi:MAG: hypothetical protein HY708_02550, partial [Ignavibacteriae bacterium]|nr:hypothetical protein [Ignavibacteriota bacterium]